MEEEGEQWRMGRSSGGGGGAVEEEGEQWRMGRSSGGGGGAVEEARVWTRPRDWEVT